jgi:predicted nucleic acid-binding protein
MHTCDELRDLGRLHRLRQADALVLMDRAGETLDGVALLPLDRALLLAAGALAEPALRALDAIHVASAVDLGPLDGFVTYDEREAAAARLAGLRTISPGC